jgi:Siphovirus Gp157
MGEKSEFANLLVQEGFAALDLSQPEQVELAVEYADNLDDLIEMLKAKRNKVADMVRGMETRKERFRTYILDFMAHFDTQELEGVAMRFRMSRSQPRLVLDVDKIEDKFKKQVVSYEPDRELIEAALDRGEEVVGARYETGRQLRRYVKKTKGEI